MNKRIVIFLLISLLFVPVIFSADDPPPTETIGGTIQQKKQFEKERNLEKKIKLPKKKTEEEGIQDLISEDAGEKVLIKKIIVEGVTLLKKKEIDKIISQFKGKELSIKAMQRIADLITDEYRKKGFVTSRAYIPPQNIKKGSLTIRVVEGSLGNLEIKGNRYFKTSLLKRKLNLKQDRVFDYSALQRSLTNINEHPDRTARAILVPGKEPGTTDVVLEVEDNFPFHIGFEFDNYGSRYIEKDRYTVFLEHNNLLGLDDKLFLQMQQSEYSYYELENGSYTLPINNTTDVGIYGLSSDTALGREFEGISKGKAHVYGLFLNKSLIAKPDIDLRLNLGFDHKDIKNYILGSLADGSHDELSIFKGGFDLDLADKWGRTIFTSEVDFGVPGFLGSMDAKDARSSRTGAGAKFVKGVFNLFRFQPGPFSSYILWKNQAQISNYNLVASEQFQIGGPSSVRGYPAAEFAGDKGYYTSLEWSFPTYFLPKKLNVPFTKDVFRDALHMVLFYDWATIRNKQISYVGDKTSRTLKSAGFGFRLNLSNNLSARIEFGYPIGKKSSDGHNLQQWIEITSKF